MGSIAVEDVGRGIRLYMTYVECWRPVGNETANVYFVTGVPISELAETARKQFVFIWLVLGEILGVEGND